MAVLSPMRKGPDPPPVLTTRKDYLEEIARWQERRPGAVPQIQKWIDVHIAYLQKEMDKLKCSKTAD
jgi:hypothetical protein